MINDGIKIVQDNVQLTQPADNNFPMRWVTVKQAGAATFRVTWGGRKTLLFLKKKKQKDFHP